jgi:hypothetical protein
MNLRSIGRRISKLEEELSEAGVWSGRRDRGRRRFPVQPLRLRLGELRGLPENYQGDRHVEITNHLGVRDGREWVEFAEVPGPEPNSPPQDPRLPRYLDVILVPPPRWDI